MPLEKLRIFLGKLGGVGPVVVDETEHTHFTAREKAVAEPLLRAVTARLGFLIDVGLDYLSLDSQRADALERRGPAHPFWPRRSARRSWASSTCSTSRPVGLHARDNARLIEAQARLRDLGNTVFVVSTIARPSSLPTGWSTWARAPACTAARSSPRARLPS